MFPARSTWVIFKIHRISQRSAPKEISRGRRSVTMAVDGIFCVPQERSCVISGLGIRYLFWMVASVLFKSVNKLT